MTIRCARLIYNPKAGSLHGGTSIIERLADELRQRGLDLEMQATRAAGDATRLAALAVSEKIDALIVCGGDGTINEAAQSLAASETVLAVFPCGTANVFAKDLNLTRDPVQMANLIASAQLRRISLGRASKPDASWHRYFLLMAGIGIDAEVVRRVNYKLKKKIGIGAYFAAGIEYLARWPLKRFTLQLNEKNYEATYAVISNSPNYGGGFIIAPGAKLDDDQLNVCIFDSDSRLEYMGYAALAVPGKHTDCENVTYVESRLIRADAAQETWVQLDGELVGTLPMNFEILPHSLTVISG
jgi:YegS/Rv2252/BmrU family lipid kinase